MKKHKSPPVVEVPLAEDMDDDTFLNHLEKRHIHEVKVEGYIHRHAVDAWIGCHRAFHDRLHQISVPDQYDHEHVEEDEC